MTTRWVVLLRGVNVGSGNRIAMADLRATLERLGYEQVRTYIQSGNVVVDAPGTERTVATAIAAALSEHHGLTVPVVVRDAAEVDRIANAHPDADGLVDPKLLHVWFLDREPAPEAVAALDLAPYAPDRLTIVGREGFVRYPNGSGRSALTIDVAERAFGVRATGRNLNTVRALAELARP